MLCCLPALGTFYLSQSMRRKVSPYHTCPNQNRIFCMLHGEKKVTTSPRRRSEQRRPGGTAQTQANNSILNRNDRNLINTRICWPASEELHRDRSSDAPDHPISLVWLQRDMGMQQQQRCRVERGEWSGEGRQVEGGGGTSFTYLEASSYRSRLVVCIGKRKITDLICLTNCSAKAHTRTDKQRRRKREGERQADIQRDSQQVSRHIEISSKDRTTSWPQRPRTRVIKNVDNDGAPNKPHWNILTAVWQALRFKRNVSSAFEVFRSLTKPADSWDQSRAELHSWLFLSLSLSLPYHVDNNDNRWEERQRLGQQPICYTFSTFCFLNIYFFWASVTVSWPWIHSRYNSLENL